MDHDRNLITWLRVVIAAALATAMGVVFNASGSQAALEYDPSANGGTAALGELTRFEIDGDGVPGVNSNTAVTPAAGVDADWQSTPYGPQPPTSDPATAAPDGIGSSGLVPLLFADIKADDFPIVTPSPNPAFGLPGEPEFCTGGKEDGWVGGEKVQKVSIDNPLYNVDGDQALECASVLDKGNLFSTYAAYETVTVPNDYGNPDAGSQNHVIIYGAWERGEVPGELNFYIPIADAVAGNSAGDRMIAFDYDSSAPASYRILAWDGANWATVASGTAAVNGDTFAAAVGYADGTSFTSGSGAKPSFGEFALDLTATGILPGNTGPCVELSTAGFVFTETGNSANAQLKDFVGAPRIPISNCGPLSVTKAGPAGVTNSPTFDFRVEQQDSTPIFDAAPATTPASTTTQYNDQFVLGETVTLDQVLAQPDYLAFEEPVSISGAAPAALPTGWEMVSVDCTYIDGFTAGYPVVTEQMYLNTQGRLTDADGDVKVVQVHSTAFNTLTGHDGFVPNCVITNDAAGIVVAKETVPDGSTTAFPFTVTDGVDTETPSLADGESAFYAFDAGTSVTITEGAATGTPSWNLTDVTCLDEDGSPAIVTSESADGVTLDVGSVDNTITCTFTNTQNSSLTLVKNVVNDNGGEAMADAWTLAAAGTTPFSGTSGVSSVVEPGAYTLSESGGPADYAQLSWSCDAGTLVGEVVTLAPGDVATCTVTNDDDAPSLTLIKEVVNDNGGTAVPGDWSLVAAGYDAVSPDAGTYALSETGGPAGYTLTSLTCDNVEGQVTSVTLALGEDVTCTFVNDDDAPSLTLVKEVVNDNGGTAVATAWTLVANGTTPVAGNGTASSGADFVAGGYTLSELGAPGYTLTSLTCSNSGDVQVTSVTLGLGEDVTCTFVNDDDAPSLTLVKEVVNDNGGTAVPGDWSLVAAGYDAVSPDAGTYALSETGGPAGYTLTSLTCSNSGDVQVTEVTLALGEDVTCTFVNDDDAPSLTLVKEVVNNNGGTAEAGDFTLTAAGPTGISGPGGATSDATFRAGTYDLSESGPAGYTASDWVCIGGEQDGDAVTIDLGDDVTCTIVNDDNGPGLSLVKIVVNDNGGSAVAADFTLTGDGPTPVTGQGMASSDDSFVAGTYALSESGPAGYAASAWTCEGGEQDGSSITLGLGEAATCTIVNDDIAPSLTLVKRVVNDDGGNAVAGDFTISATGPASVTGQGTASSDDSFVAGSYLLSETGVAGYQLASITCDNVEGPVTSVTVDLAEDVTCTFTNDDAPVDLQLTKDDGGYTAVAGGDPIPYTITVDNVGERDVDAGEPATVTDTLPSYLSWVTPVPAGCAVAGQTLTCVIQPAALEVSDPPVVFDLLVDVASDAPSGDFVNRAWVDLDDDPVCEGAGCTPPPCPATTNNNVDCEETPIERFATITIVKVDDVADGAVVEPGDTYRYTLTVTNNGPSTILPGLAVDDDLPAQLEFVSAAGGADWTCNTADPVACTYGPELTPGATAPSITVTVRVAGSATGEFIENVAVATGYVETDCLDVPARLGEALSACDPITDSDDEVTPLQANADLAIVKTAGISAPTAPGRAFDWVLEVTNNGPGAAVNVVVADVVPSSLSVTGVTSSFFECARSGNAVTCTRDSMAVDASGTITIAVTVNANATSGTIENVGNVDSDTPDPNLSNNSDDASVVVVVQEPPEPPVASTLPATGSDATGGLVKAAFLLIMLGGAVVLVTRRRRDEEPGTLI